MSQIRTAAMLISLVTNLESRNRHHLLLRLGMCGAIPPLSHTSPWRGVVQMRGDH